MNKPGKLKKLTTEELELESSNVVEINICLTCSTIGECEDVLILTFEGTDFVNIVDSCMGFKLSGQTKLKYMCLECINTIISFHAFKIAALNSFNELSEKESVIIKDQAKPDNQSEATNLNKPENQSEAKPSETTSETSEHIVFLNIEDENLIDIDDNEADNDNSTESVVINNNSKESEVDTTELKAEAIKRPSDVIKSETDDTELTVESIELKIDADAIDSDAECEEIKVEATSKQDISLHEINEPMQVEIIHKLSAKALREQNQWQCTYCNVLISKNNPAGIKKHRYLEKAKRLRIYECPVCHRKYTKQVIDEHILRHGEKKPVVCKLCKKGVSSQQALKNHMMLHNGKKYKCDVCKKGFTQQFLLKEHMSTHDKDTSFLCPTCGMSFPNPTRLRQHMYAHKKKARTSSTKGDKALHICDFCGKSYSSAKTLEVHRTNHASDEKFECGRCGKEFGHRALLTSHVWLHIAEFRCQKCFKIFQKDDLRKHDCIPLPKGQVFDDFLPNECKKCGEILQDGMMNRHMRRHEARECKICGEKFFTARKFQFHQNVHNLKCQLCDKRFVKNESYILHTANKVCERINSNYIKSLMK